MTRKIFTTLVTALYFFPAMLHAQPNLRWSTYFGGADKDRGKAVAMDPGKNVYILGETESTTGIATEDVYQEMNAGGDDIFLAKFNAEGDLVWATYFGGESDEGAAGIVVDTAGNIFISGWTLSTTGIATDDAWQETNAGEDDAFLAKFNNDGALLWATYYGGEAQDNMYGGGSLYYNGTSIYMCGTTWSETGIAPAITWQPELAGSSDAFWANFDSDGNLLSATYYGGPGEDRGIAISGYGNDSIYISGLTNSGSNMAIGGVHQDELAGGEYDAFLTQFSSFGIWGTYFGGAGEEIGEALSCDATYVYMAGTTNSTDGIATSGAFQETAGGGTDMFLAKFKRTGSLEASTYFGGTGDDHLTSSPSVAADGGGGVFIGGQTNSSSGMVTLDAYQEDLGGGYDGVIARFGEDLEEIWGTYIGGTGTDNTYAIITNRAGKTFVAGSTASISGIATEDAWQADLAGDSDGFLMALDDCDTAWLNVVGDTTVCEGFPLIMTTEMEGATFRWFRDGVQIGTAWGTTHAVLETGAYTVITTSGICKDTSEVANITVNPAPTPVIVNTDGTLSTVAAYTGYQWNLDGDPISGAFLSTYTPTTPGVYSVTVRDANGCRGTSDNYTGIENNKKETRIAIYPNPATDNIHIYTPFSGSAILYGSDGRVILQDISISTGVNIIDLTSISTGNYWLHLFDKDGKILYHTMLSKR